MSHFSGWSTMRTIWAISFLWIAFVCFSSHARLSPVLRLADSPYRSLPRLQRALHLGLRVDEKIRAGDDAFSFVETGLHFVEVAVFAAEFDKARLQLALALVHKDNVVLAGWQ